jgi:hypothetical protein
MREWRGATMGKIARRKWKLMAVADSARISFSIDTASAGPHEIALVEATAAGRVLTRPRLPDRRSPLHGSEMFTERGDTVNRALVSSDIVMGLRWDIHEASFGQPARRANLDAACLLLDIQKRA